MSEATKARASDIRSGLEGLSAYFWWHSFDHPWLGRVAAGSQMLQFVAGRIEADPPRPDGEFFAPQAPAVRGTSPEERLGSLITAAAYSLGAALLDGERLAGLELAEGDDDRSAAATVLQSAVLRRHLLDAEELFGQAATVVGQARWPDSGPTTFAQFDQAAARRLLRNVRRSLGSDRVNVLGGSAFKQPTTPPTSAPSSQPVQLILSVLLADARELSAGWRTGALIR